MLIFNKIQELRAHLDSARAQHKTIGFVPTMGALHQGHISLINKAKSDCDLVVCSIFVNPTQFNDLSDLEKYPRTLDADCQLLEKVDCDVVFAPETLEIYSEKELQMKKQGLEDKSWTNGLKVDFGSLDKVMEGAHRPGHFNGVAQVVSKLFRMVQPHKAYFGQKDFQQLAIIKSMVHQLNMNIEIIACPILREANGLAMSSRNERLTAEERNLASIISKTLFKIKELYNTSKIEELKKMAQQEFLTQPKIELEYIEIVDAQTLQPINDFRESASAVVCVAVKLGLVRLIDNVVLY